MSKSIKNRVFGSTVPDWLKDKIEIRQKLSKSSEFGDSINDSNKKEYNFDGLADLSSRTPFARMWTGLSVFEDVKTPDKEPYDTDAKVEGWWTDRAKGLDNEADKKDWENKYLKSKGGEVFEEHEWVKIQNDFQRIYVLGNHTLNTLERGPGAEMTSGKGTGEKAVSTETMRAILPHEQETDNNQFLKPPAGITSITSETEGPLGSLKKTTVNFIVHNFYDFEKIYLKYFMKPGAQVFIDFGWDTADLYAPEELLTKDDIEDYLYGETGVVPTSNGDFETTYGNVINYDAKVREDGGFDCSVEIVSKNAAILGNDVDQKRRDAIAGGLDKELQGLFGSIASGDIFWINNALKVGQSTEGKEEAGKSILEFGIGISTGRLPGEPTSMLSLEHGIFIFSPNGPTGKNTTYLNYGWFEDNILNREFGFSDSRKGLLNITGDDVALDEGKTFAKFNSRNSFMIYHKDLHDRMKNMENNPMTFIYPNSWGSYGSTYNSKIKMVPDDRYGTESAYWKWRNGAPKEPVTIDSSQSGEYKMVGAPDEPIGVDDTYSIEKWDTTMNRIPIREIFINTAIIKESIKESSSPGQFLKSILKRINSEADNYIQLDIMSTSYGQHTLAVGDRALNGAVTNEFLDTLLQFNPYSPDTIVKEYELSFTMPQGGMGNMIAVQNSTLTENVYAINSLIDSFIELEHRDRQEIINKGDNDKEIINKYVKTLPSMGIESGYRLEKRSGEEGASIFGFSEENLTFSGDQKKVKTNQIISSVELQGVKNATDVYTKFNEKTQDRVYDKINQKSADSTKSDEDKSEDGDAKDFDEESRKMAKEKQYELVNNREEYYKRKASKSISEKVPSLIQIEASLKIYGISGFVPGDLIRISYLPERYYNNVYFQVLGVSHDIGETWSTSLKTVMKIDPVRDFKKPVKIKKTYLNNIYGGLEGIKKVGRFNLGLIGDLIPKQIQKNAEGRLPQSIQYVFETELIKNRLDGKKSSGENAPLGYFPRIECKTNDAVEVVKDAVNALSKKMKKTDASPIIKIKYSDIEDNVELGEGWFDWSRPDKFQFYNVVDPTDEAGQKNTKKGQIFWIVTSGANWLILPFDPSNDWSEVDTLFRYAGRVSHVFKKLADKTKKEQQDGRKETIMDAVVDTISPGAGAVWDGIKWAVGSVFGDDKEGKQ